MGSGFRVSFETSGPLTLLVHPTQVINRNLFWDSEAKSFFWVPVGVAPTKTEKDLRMKRDFLVKRKFLSEEWSADMLAFMEADYPTLCRYFGLPEGPAMEPPKRATIEEKAPFLFFSYDDWRHQVKRVGKVTSNNMRGALEQYLLEETETDKGLAKKRSFQAFLSHSSKVSLKHYYFKDAKELSAKLRKLHHKK